MKILLVGIVATVLGLGGGALVAGTRLKGEFLERLQEEQNASATGRTLETRDDGSGREASNSTAVQTSVDSSANEPAAGVDGEDTTGDGQEQARPVPGGEGPSEPVPGATSSDSIPESTGPGGSDIDVGEPSEPVVNAASDDSTPESTGPAGSAMDDGPRIDPEASRKLAKIFEAMRPADAAEVLQGMKNSEVRGILLSMDERQAAAILGDFEAARAAALSQLVLMTPPSGGGR